MQSKNEIIAALTTQLDKQEKKIEALRSQLEDALEVNEELQQPTVDSYHDL